MAAASFTNASTGESDGLGTLAAAYPATILADDLLVLHCAINNDVDTITTPSGWTLAAGPLTVGPTGRSYLYTKVAAGTETGTFPVTWTAINKMTSRTYCFTDTDGTYADGVIRAGSSTTFAPQSVTTDVDDALVCQFVHIPRGQFTIGAFTGEAGGDYTEAVAEWQDGAGTDGNTIQLQTADVATAGTTISGGSATIASSQPWGCISFTIRPTGGSPPLVFDGSFESGITNWFASGAGSVASSGVQAHGGSKSLYLVPAAADETAFLDNVTIDVSPATDYTLYGWAYLTSDASVRMGWNEFDVSDVYQATVSDGWTSVLQGSWQQFTVAGTTSASTTQIQPFLGAGTTYAAMYIDDISVVGTVAPPPPSGATPKLTLLGAG